MRILPLLLALAVAGSACTGGPAVRTEPIEPELATATFDSAWGLIHDTHFDAAFAEGEWMQVRDELRPRALAAVTQESLRAVLRDMIGHIDVSHFGLIEKDAADDFLPAAEGEKGADLGIHLRLLDDTMVVSKVDPGSAADDAGVRTGWILSRIDERDIGDTIERAKARIDEDLIDLLSWSLASNLLRGPDGESIDLEFEDGEGESREMSLVFRPSPGQVNRFGNLPPARAILTKELREERGARVGVIAFNIWLISVAPEFDRAVDEFRDADGIVVDLRGNLGGLGGMAMGIAGHFIDERASLGTMKTRGSELEFRVNPRRTDTQGQRVKPFEGPVAILIDPLSLSTSEIFSGGVQAVGRARVFGETSSGAALPSRLTELPNGDVLQHAFADFVDPDGVRLEGRGVVPDVEIPLRREDLLAGRDIALEAAIEWIASQQP